MLIAEHTATIEACRFCFMCRHVCTVGVVSGRESDTPRGKGLILFKTLKGHIDHGADTVETLYRCCLCGLCQTWCKAGCAPPDVVLAARADVVGQGQEPEKVRQIKDNLVATGNPLGFPRMPDSRPSTRRISSVPRPRCSITSAATRPTCSPRLPTRRSASSAPRASICRCSSDEHSTGKPLWLLGYRAEARAMAQGLVEKIRASGCRTLVTGCPSSFDAFAAGFSGHGP